MRQRRTNTINERIGCLRGRNRSYEKKSTSGNSRTKQSECVLYLVIGIEPIYGGKQRRVDLRIMF